MLKNAVNDLPTSEFRVKVAAKCLLYRRNRYVVVSLAKVSLYIVLVFKSFLFLRLVKELGMN